MNKILQETARNLLAQTRVDVIIGYEEGYDAFHARPVFISSIADVDRLIFNQYCTNNLAVYLPIHKKLKIGIVAKGCDVASIRELIKEHQIPDENVVVIDVVCEGATERMDAKCAGCDGKGIKAVVGVDKVGDEVERFEELSAKEKEAFWDKEFARCIRCYACRQICPICYCPDCFVNRTMPKYLNEAVDNEKNKLFSMIRMMHVFGRCTDCRACSNACPVGIPLHLLTKKIAMDALELFGYVSGQEQEHPFSTFKKDELMEKGWE